MIRPAIPSPLRLRRVFTLSPPLPGHFSPCHRRARGRRGIALVIVLGFLTLMTVLALAFFTSVTTEVKAASNYERNVQVQQLAQSAVSIAMGNIRDATTQPSDVTWVSQPGLIRTYDSNGAIKNAYRLYSTSNMKGNDENPASGTTDRRRTEWAEYTAHMVDMNRPVKDASGNLVYPIFDPRAETSADPVEGFEFDASVMGPKFLTEESPAPMPVRWFYVLANGEIVFGKETEKTIATFEAATKENPIVGRIAFWTDDESCKININTAAGDEWDPANVAYGKAAGSYWDQPRTNSTFDRQALAKFQPAQGEYQRFPGHPATTYLSAVFPSLTSEQIGAIASRIKRGGSLGGTEVADAKLTGDADRLYASIEELVFDPRREDQPVNKEKLDQGRFFLTAHSRAPEANLFNMPRIAA
ncbi:MAG: Verru_Chthon cassette protein A [Verrucomicrobiota bacterium]|nr:Verru_Chthon cassette protein A [Verrucomicrobiota bacterium]